MKQTFWYLAMGLALIAAIVGWQLYDNDDNALPANYRDLVIAAATAIPEIGPGAQFEFAGAPEEVLPRKNTGNSDTAKDLAQKLTGSAVTQWTGAVRITPKNGGSREWLYVLANGKVAGMMPLTPNPQ